MMMKHIKKYDQINEELTRKQRMLAHMPLFLGGILLKKLFGITTLLNYRWEEIKKKTTDSKFDPVLATSSKDINRMNRTIRKITKKDIPDNKLKFAMFLRSWNLYLVEGDTHSDSWDKDESKKRKIVYITKDEISTGDFYTGERISDWDVYSEFEKSKKPSNLAEYPIIVMIAKADKAGDTEDLSANIDYIIDDICLDLKDEFNASVKIMFDRHGDKLSLLVSPKDGYSLFIDEKFNNYIENIKKSVKSYLNSQGFNMNCKKEEFKIDQNIWYFGDKGRFEEIRKFGILYDKEEGTRYYANNDRMVSNLNGINIRKCSSNLGVLHNRNMSRYNLSINRNDIDTLISDPENCYTSPTSLENKADLSRIKIDHMSIYFELEN